MIAIFPEIAGAAEKKNFEHLALLTRKYFAKGKERGLPRFDITTLAENVGLEVFRMKLKFLGAILVKDENGIFTVKALIDEKIAGAQYNFLLAHLLGHFLMHIQPKITQSGAMTSGYSEILCPLQRYAEVSENNSLEHEKYREPKEEREADEFAAALLLPKFMLEKLSEKTNTTVQAANLFQVPMKLLKARQMYLESKSTLNVPQVSEPQKRTGVGRKKSFAASAYENGFNAPESPESTEGPPKKRQTMKPTTRTKPTTQLKGIEKIREIARQMDSGVK